MVSGFFALGNAGQFGKYLPYPVNFSTNQLFNFKIAVSNSLLPQNVFLF
jgi:hypothetical protein